MFFLSKIKNKIDRTIAVEESRKIGHIGKNPHFTKDLTIIGGNHISIGDGFYAGPGCRIEAWDEFEGEIFSPKLEVGNNVKINSKCHIGVINLIKIGNNVLLGSNVFITDHSHGNNTYAEASIAPTHRRLYSKGEVIIGNNCWLCEDVIILPGVHIGKCSVVAAGAVVTHDVPEYSVVAGNPARVLKTIK